MLPILWAVLWLVSGRLIILPWRQRALDVRDHQRLLNISRSERYHKASFVQILFDPVGVEVGNTCEPALRHRS